MVPVVNEMKEVFDAENVRGEVDERWEEEEERSRGERDEVVGEVEEGEIDETNLNYFKNLSESKVLKAGPKVKDDIADGCNN